MNYDGFLDTIPDGWEWSPGESNRPLRDGGYYLHVVTYTLWENQYKRRYLEARIDCSDYTQSEGPKRHHVILTERVEDKVEGDSWGIRRLTSETIDVDHRNSEFHQIRAEVTIHEIAREIMEEYPKDD